MRDNASHPLPDARLPPPGMAVALTGPAESIVRLAWQYPQPSQLGASITALRTGELDRYLRR